MATVQQPSSVPATGCELAQSLSLPPRLARVRWVG